MYNLLLFRIGKRFSSSPQSHSSRYPLNLPYHSSSNHDSSSKNVPPYQSLDSIGGIELHPRPPTLQQRFPLFAHLTDRSHPLASASTKYTHHPLSSNDHLSLFPQDHMRLPENRQEDVDYDHELYVGDDDEDLALKRFKVKHMYSR